MRGMELEQVIYWFQNLIVYFNLSPFPTFNSHPSIMSAPETSHWRPSIARGKSLSSIKYFQHRPTMFFLSAKTSNLHLFCSNNAHWTPTSTKGNFPCKAPYLPGHPINTNRLLHTTGANVVVDSRGPPRTRSSVAWKTMRTQMEPNIHVSCQLAPQGRLGTETADSLAVSSKNHCGLTVGMTRSDQ